MGLFSIVAKLTANTSDFDRKTQRSLSKVETASRAAAASIKGWLAGAFSVGAIIALEKRVIVFGSKIKDMSDRLGISSDEVQKLSFAAEQGGASLDAMATALARLGKVRSDIMLGKTAEGADQDLAAIGLTGDSLGLATTAELMRKIAASPLMRPNNVERGAIAQRLFGRAGEQLLPVFDSGLEQLSARLEGLNAIISEDNIKNLKAAGDALTDLNNAVIAFGAEAAPLLVSGLESLRDMAVMVKDLDFSNPLAFAKSLGSLSKKTVTGMLVKPLASTLSQTASSALGAGQGGAATVPATSTVGATIAAQAQTLNAGSLAAVGGFVGGAGSRNVVLDVQKQMLSELKDANRSLDNIERKGGVEF